MIRAPSIKSLTTALKDVTVEQAKQIRWIIKCTSFDLLIEYAETFSPKSTAHFRKCFNMPSFNEAKAAMLDEILDTCGVEYLFKGSDGLRTDPEGMYDSPICTYLNAGDTYATTLLRYRGRWQIGCYGDIVERYM
jgi:hypothetical protein